MQVSTSAKATLDVLQHLWQFSLVSAADVTAPDGLVGKVDPVFCGDAKLSKAAALVTTMLPLARELHSSNRRLGLATEELEGSGRGTVEAALRNLIAYRNQLENRLAQRFMDACSRDVRPPSSSPHPCLCGSCRAGMNACCHLLTPEPHASPAQPHPQSNAKSIRPRQACYEVSACLLRALRGKPTEHSAQCGLQPMCECQGPTVACF